MRICTPDSNLQVSSMAQRGEASTCTQGGFDKSMVRYYGNQSTTEEVRGWMDCFKCSFKFTDVKKACSKDF